MLRRNFVRAPAGIRTRTATLEECRAACYTTETLMVEMISPPGIAPDPTPSHSVMRLLHHGNVRLIAGAGNAPAYHRLQRRANLSQLPSPLTEIGSLR